MAKHSFYKEVRDAAKADGKSLFAMSFRGRTIDMDAESPVDDAIGKRLWLLCQEVIKSGITDPELVPKFESPK